MGLFGISFKTAKQKEENRIIRNLETLRNLLETHAKPKTEQLNNTVNNLIDAYKIAILLKKDYCIDTKQDIENLPRFDYLINMNGKPQLKDIYHKNKDVFMKGDLELFKEYFPDAFNKNQSNDKNNNNFQYFLNDVIDSIARFTVGTNQHPDLTENQFEKTEMYINRTRQINLMNNKFENLSSVDKLINLTKDKIEPTYNVLQKIKELQDTIKIKELQDTISKNNLNKKTGDIGDIKELLNKYENNIKNNKKLLTKEEAEYYNKNIYDAKNIINHSKASGLSNHR